MYLNDRRLLGTKKPSCIKNDVPVIPLELEIFSLDFLSFPRIKLKTQFLLPLFPQFSTEFCLKVATSQRGLTELPQNCLNFCLKIFPNYRCQYPAS
jgi:hypothetical protein